MKSAYYDTTYIFKLQCEEAGTAEVRAHAGTVDVLISSIHGRAEFVSACHRKIREGAGTLSDLHAMLSQMRKETSIGALRWLPVTERTVTRFESFFLSAPSSAFVRAADALHLACAAENGFTEIHSNDRHLLTAAPLFGLRGLNVIPG